MARPHIWDYKQRQTLKYLIAEGYQMNEIADVMKITPTSIRTELRRGLDKKNGSSKRWIKYDPLLASRNAVIKCIGEDGLQALVEYETGIGDEDRKIQQIPGQIQMEI